MKTFQIKNSLRKHGRKALVLYFLWCLLKGLFFLFAGARLFDACSAHPKGAAADPVKAAEPVLHAAVLNVQALSQSFGHGNHALALMSMLAIVSIVGVVRWMDKVILRDYDIGPANRFISGIDEEMFR